MVAVLHDGVCKAGVGRLRHGPRGGGRGTLGLAQRCWVRCQACGRCVCVWHRHTFWQVWPESPMQLADSTNPCSVLSAAHAACARELAFLLTFQLRQRSFLPRPCILHNHCPPYTHTCDTSLRLVSPCVPPNPTPPLQHVGSERPPRPQAQRQSRGGGRAPRLHSAATSS